MKIQKWLYGYGAIASDAPITVIGFAVCPAIEIRSHNLSTIRPTIASRVFASGANLAPSNETQLISGRAESKPATTKAETNRMSKTTQPIHWTDTTDEVVYLVKSLNEGRSETFNSPFRVQFTVRGQPLALKRHRSSRGFLYNPSAKQQASFCTAVKGLLHNVTAPVFPLDDYLAISMVFSLKRPKKHYVGNKVEADRLRPSAPLYVKTLPDVDNLAKFVLDSMNGFLFHDDRQVASLQLTKVYADVPATRITVQKLCPRGASDFPVRGDEMEDMSFS